MPKSADTTTFEIFDVVRLFRLRFEEAIAASDVVVTSAEARVLTNLAVHGSLRQAEIADRLAIGAMSVTSLIDRLERSGFVRREPDPDDRRANRVHLTDRSEPVLRRIGEVKALLSERARVDIDPEDYATYTDVVRRIRKNLLSSETVGDLANTATGKGAANA